MNGDEEYVARDFDCDSEEKERLQRWNENGKRSGDDMAACRVRGRQNEKVLQGKTHPWHVGGRCT